MSAMRMVARPAGFRTLCTSTPTTNASSRAFLKRYRFGVGSTFVGLSLALPWTLGGPVRCADDLTPPSPASRPYRSPSPVGGAAGAPPESILNVKELGFGTVAGLCAGVFIKKGLKTAAFLLGGAFIFLQYMSSRGFVQVNWGGLTNSYETFITRYSGSKPGTGADRLNGIVKRTIDFVSADIQARGTFVVGLVLGLRLG